MRCNRYILVCLAGQLCSVALAGDWPQFRGPERDGVSKETGLAASWPRGGPPVVWDKRVGEGYSGPVVAGNRMILFHRLDDKEVVECLDAGEICLDETRG